MQYLSLFMILQSNPAFSVDMVTPTAGGANIVRSYTEVDYPFDEQQLRDMGKSDMIISLVSAVCSNLHLVVVITSTFLASHLGTQAFFHK